MAAQTLFLRLVQEYAEREGVTEVVNTEMIFTLVNHNLPNHT